MNRYSNSSRWLVALTVATVSCSQGDTRGGGSLISPTAQGGGSSSSSSVGAYPANDVGIPAYSRLGASGLGDVGSSAAGDVQNGPIEILRVRVRPKDAPGFYAEPGGTYRVNPGTPVEFWVEWTSSTPLATPPRLAMDWDFSESDNINCGSCLINKTFPAGRRVVTIRMDDRVGGLTKRTFTILAEFEVAEPVCAVLATATTVNGTINGASPLQLGRVFRDATPSTCPSKAYPGLFNAATSYGYTVHSYTIQGGAATCLTVNFDPNSGGTPCGTNAHMSAYIGSYDPANQSANFVGDVGSSITQPFDFTVPAGATFRLVVTNTSSAATCNYQFSFTTSVCQ